MLEPLNSPGYTKEFRINQSLKIAQQAALAIKDDEKSTEVFSYELELPECNIKSCAELALFDPRLLADGSSLSSQQNRQAVIFGQSS